MTRKLFFSFLNDFAACDWAADVEVLGHVTLIMTVPCLAALSIRLVARVLVVVVQDLAGDDVYPLIPINKRDVGLTPLVHLLSLLGLRILAHISRLVHWNFIFTQLVLLLSSILSRLHRLRPLKVPRNLSVACLREAVIGLLVDFVGAEDDGGFVILYRLPSGLGARVLEQRDGVRVGGIGGGEGGGLTGYALTLAVSKGTCHSARPVL